MLAMLPLQSHRTAHGACLLFSGSHKVGGSLKLPSITLLLQRRGYVTSEMATNQALLPLFRTIRTRRTDATNGYLKTTSPPGIPQREKAWLKAKWLSATITSLTIVTCIS